MGSLGLIEFIERFAGGRVLCIGDLMLDRFVTGQVDRISPEGPVPVFLTRRVSTMLGGVGNVARNVASLGGQASLVAVVGADGAAAEASALVRELAGGDGLLIEDPSRSTIVKTRFVAAGQQLLRVDEEQVHAIAPAIEELVVARCVTLFADCDAVVLSDYAKGVLTDRVLGEIIEQARRAGRPVIVDPKSRHYSRYAHASLITPNAKELAQMVGYPCDDDEAVIEAAREVRAAGAFDAIAVTRSEKGMTLVTGSGTVMHERATAQEVFDVSGAGDTVVASLAMVLAARGSLEIACRIANEAAGIAVSKSGTAAVGKEELRDAVHRRMESRRNRRAILDRTEVLDLVHGWRERALTVGFTNGCFDILHPGHVHLLNATKRHCDRLILAINSDASVRRLKGPERPINDVRSRAEVLSGLTAVDAVVAFDEDTPLTLIEALRPDVLVKGGDYTIETVVGADVVQGYGGKVILIDLLAGHSTTRMVESLRQPQGVA